MSQLGASMFEEPVELKNLSLEEASALRDWKLHFQSNYEGMFLLIWSEICSRWSSWIIIKGCHLISWFDWRPTIFRRSFNTTFLLLSPMLPGRSANGPTNFQRSGAQFYTITDPLDTSSFSLGTNLSQIALERSSRVPTRNQSGAIRIRQGFFDVFRVIWKHSRPSPLKMPAQTLSAENFNPSWKRDGYQSKVF